MNGKLNIIQFKLVVIVLFINFNVFGQCPPDDFPNDFVYLITQEDVDNFIIDYPNCTELQTLLIGDVIPSTITNLNGLINLENVGWLQMTNIPTTNLQGLNSLQSVDIFVIYYMPDLLSLEGLDSLETVTGQEFSIELCASITSLQGLESLNSYDGGYFNISNNNSLMDSSGLDCYFFSEEFRSGVSNYSIQESLYPSILANCNINLSVDNVAYSNVLIHPNPAKTHIY